MTDRTFGIDFGSVVEHVRCPRCEAPAVIRASSRGARVYEDNLVCEKCHLVRFVRLTTLDAMNDQKALLRFSTMKKKARTKRERERIDRKIEEINRRMMLHGLIEYRVKEDE